MAPSLSRPPGQPVARRPIPGPRGLPWLGQLPAYLGTKFFPQQMLKWAEEFNGVYEFQLVGKKYLVVTDPALIPPIVGRGFPGLPKSRGYAMWDSAISPHAGVQGLFTVSGNTLTWRAVRRAYGPAMGPGSLGEHYPIILSCAATLGDHIEVAGGRGAAPLELNHLAKCLTLDMLGRSAFGLDLGCTADPAAASLPHNIERAMLECGARARSVGRRLLPWLHAEEAREGAEAMASFHAFIEDIWRGIQAKGPPAEDDTSMAAQLMRLADPARGAAPLSDQQICAEIATIVIAGYETTANTLTWMFMGLHAYPEAAARLLEELRGAGLAPPAAPSALSSTAYPAPSAAASTAATAAPAARPASPPFDVTAAFRSLADPGPPSTAQPLPHGGGAAPPAGPPSSTAAAASTASPSSPPSSSPSASASASAAALSRLPYLDAYVRECLRLYSTAPNGVLKEVPAGGPPAQIGPYEAEPGAVVWAPFWGLHLSALNWERPLQFEPERWLGHDPRTAGAVSASRCPVAAAVSAIRAATGAAAPTATPIGESGLDSSPTSHVPPLAGVGGSSTDEPAAAAAATAAAAASGGSSTGDTAAASAAAAAAAAAAKSIRFMPFGDGARNCVGQHLALLQLKVVLSYMAARFELALDERRMGGVAGAIARQRVNLTLEVEGGMWMTARPRA